MELCTNPVEMSLKIVKDESLTLLNPKIMNTADFQIKIPKSQTARGSKMNFNSTNPSRSIMPELKMTFSPSNQASQVNPIKSPIQRVIPLEKGPKKTYPHPKKPQYSVP